MRIYIVLLYFLLNQSFAHQYEKNGIIISHPILKMVTNDGKMGAGYFKIKNNSDNKIQLVSIISNIAKKQEIHEVVEENNVYKMRPIEEALIVLPGKELIFKSKSYHVMFFGINKSHVNDEMLDAKMNFKNNVINIKFKVLIGNQEHKHH
ncbi:copper chaperone PCu(A)C [Alphaproteobacteria bacterium]|nr:copper chaperone PCu(A)C [Alphaproteobacteria bacterium]